MDINSIKPIDKLIVNITDSEIILNDSQKVMELTSVLFHNSTPNSENFNYSPIKDGLLTIQENLKKQENHKAIQIILAKPQMFAVRNIYKQAAQNYQVSSIVVKLNQPRKIIFKPQEVHKQTFENLLPKGKYQQNTINQEGLHSGIHFNLHRKFRVQSSKENDGHLLLHQVLQK